MAANIKIFHERITAQQAQGERGIDLMHRLRPDWPKDKIVHKVLSGGQLNIMMRFFLESDKEDAIVLRLYGDNEEGGRTADGIVIRDNEAIVMQLAHHMACFPPILAFFPNGMAYKYAVGRMLTVNDFENPDFIGKITGALCRFHNVDLGQCAVVDRTGTPTKFDTSFKFYEDMRIILRNLPEHLIEDKEKAQELSCFNLSRTWVMAEIDALEKILEPLDLPKSICHYDFHLRNALYNKEDESMTVLDLEMVKIGYEAYDIGGLFVEGPWRSTIPDFWCGADAAPHYTEKIQLVYAREYITQKLMMKGREASDVTEDDVRLQHLQHQLMETAYHLNWIVMFLFLISTETPEVELSDVPSIKVEYPLYMESKKHLPGLVKQYLETKSRMNGT